MSWSTAHHAVEHEDLPRLRDLLAPAPTSKTTTGPDGPCSGTTLMSNTTVTCKPALRYMPTSPPSCSREVPTRCAKPTAYRSWPRPRSEVTGWPPRSCRHGSGADAILPKATIHAAPPPPTAGETSRADSRRMKDETFVAAAADALELVPDAPIELGSGLQITPREFLRTLASVAAQWPHTPPEVWYGEIMQETFWALARGRPTPLPGEDEQSTTEALAFGVLLAMMSADRGGYHTAADVCQTALAYMRVLPAWHDVQIEADASPDHTSLTIDVVRPEPAISVPTDKTP